MFSVVIPLYNKELSIQNTIKSVLEQTYQDFEIIVIDDGSIDSSAKRIKEIKDSRVRLIQQKNQGVSAARNLGIKDATYEWIAFLDADDLWEANHLEEINNMIDKFPNQLIFTTSYELSNKVAQFKHNRDENISRVEDYFKDALSENLIWTGVVVINKKCFDKVGNFRTYLTNGEDIELWARIARQFTLVKSNTVTCIYRIDAENRTSLNKNLRSTHIYYLDIESSLSKSEFYYYKYLILNRTYSYVRVGSFLNVFLIYFRYRNNVKLKDYTQFFLYKFKSKLKISADIK